MGGIGTPGSTTAAPSRTLTQRSVPDYNRPCDPT